MGGCRANEPGIPLSVGFPIAARPFCGRAHIINADRREALAEVANQSASSEIRQPRSIPMEHSATMWFCYRRGEAQSYSHSQAVAAFGEVSRE
jgi:hypothetical protein